MENHLGALSPWQAIKIEHRHLGASNPAWGELRPEGDDNQYPQRGDALNEQIEPFTSGGIAPMNVLEHNQDGLACCPPLDLHQLGVKRLLLTFLRGKIEQRVAIVRGD